MLWIVDMKKKPRLRREVAELYSEIFREKPWKENFQPKEVMILMGEQLDGPRPEIALAAVEKRKVIGFTWMYEIFKDDLQEGTRYSPDLGSLFERGKKVFYLQEVGVEKESRRRGIGEKLIQKLLKKGKKQGANFIVLSTNSKAESAKALFSKVGFKDSGIVRPPENLGRTYWILKLKD